MHTLRAFKGPSDWTQLIWIRIWFVFRWYQKESVVSEQKRILRRSLLIGTIKLSLINWERT